MYLLSLGERLAVGTVADDVVGREALGLVQLGRLQHSQAGVDDHVGLPFTIAVTMARRSGIVMVPLWLSRLRPVDSEAVKTLARCWRRMFSTLRS